MVDPLLIQRLTEICLDKSPIKIPLFSTHPEKRAIVPLIGLGTASVRMAKQIMPGKGVFAFFIPSIFTPLHDTRMGKKAGVTQTAQLTPLQWQLMMKCWKMNLRPGQMSWWGPMAWRLGAVGLWAFKLRKLNGPGFTWPMMMFASALPEKLLRLMGRIHLGRPMKIKTRNELLEGIRPHQWRYLREDNGDVPKGGPRPSPQRAIMAQAV